MSMSSIINNLTSFEEIRDRLLYRAQEQGCDISESSFMYQALVPIAWALYDKHFDLHTVRSSLFVQSSTGAHLTQLCRERGVERLSQSPMRLSVRMYGADDIQLFDIPVGSSLKNGTVTFRIVKAEGGVYTIESIGVDEVILVDDWKPLSLVDIRRVEIESIHQYARGVETDEELQDRFFRVVNMLPYAGNVGFYVDTTKLLFPHITKVKVKTCEEGMEGHDLEVYLCRGAEDEFVLPTSKDIAEVEEGLRRFIPAGQRTLYLPPKGMNEIKVTLTVQVDSGSDRDRVESDIKSVIKTYNKQLARVWEEEERMSIYNSKLQSYILDSLPYIINIPTLRINDGDFVRLDIGDIPSINQDSIIVVVEEV